MDATKTRQPWYRRRALTSLTRRLRGESFFAETVEDELLVEDLCDHALELIEDSKWKGQASLVEAASVLAGAYALAGR